jgi:omega-3 fatty acid desaturase (delta-15 desaturase)
MSSKDELISYENLLNIIPKECFEKKPLVGTYYIIRDFFLIYSCYFLFLLTNQNIIYKLIYWNTSGFFMWCLFVDGHDCGHGTFSDSYILNTIVGHLCHTPLLVPYSTWANSHHLHHLNHNHIDNDYSHVWFSEEYKKKNKPLLLLILQKLGLIPLIGWFIYMSGAIDGGHWIPFGGRLWKNNTLYNRVHSIISSSLVLTNLYFYLYFCNFHFYTFMNYYGFPWIFFSLWLTTVTYLQHHDNSKETTLIFNDNTWTFLNGAFQTVDRSYGKPIDNLSHNITNGHLVHHLFFKKIPHYHLEKATKALYKYLKKNNIPYKYHYTPDFFIKIFKFTFHHINEAKLIE